MSKSKPDWWFREQNRFRDGEYRCPPWKGCPTCIGSMPGIAFDPLPDVDLHAAHISNDDEKLIAYTKNNTHGERDIQTRVKPGRYLKSYYPQLSHEQITFYASLIGLCSKNKEEELKFAVTADEIEHVYTTGPSSCMSHPATAFLSNPIHPSRAYEGPDLQIAYVLNGTKGNIAARVLVWPEKKRYSRIYGDAGVYSSRLKTLLEMKGYQEGTMEGARLSIVLPKAPIRDYPVAYVTPYVDGVGRFKKEGDYLVCTPRGPIPYNTGGISTPPTIACRHCGTRFISDGVQEGIRAELCAGCRDTQIAVCESHNGEVLKDTLRTLRIAGGECVKMCNECARGKYVACGACNDLWAKDALVIDSEGRQVCTKCTADTDVYAGACVRCEKPTKKENRDKRRTQVTCELCSWIMTKEKQCKEAGVTIDEKIMEMAKKHKLDPIECQVTYQAVLEAVQERYGAAV